MEQHFFPPGPERSRLHKLPVMAAVAVVCLVIGVIIASQLDLTSSTSADVPLNVFETGIMPVVERGGEFESPFVAVVERVQDAVVNVAAASRERDLPWWYRGPTYSTSSGSGFFFREDGFILTNNHVVQNAERLTVSTSSGYTYDAKVVGADPQTDLAVLKVDPEEEVAIIPFGNSDDIKVGDWAIAIGNPFPQQGLDRTVTVGVISAVGRSNLQFGRETPDYQSYIQTDASINPGNSGGPLLNLRGECVGVNSAISSPTGGSVGIGFAIPVNLARAIVPDLIANGKASRGWLGVWFHAVTQREAKRQGMDAVHGITIDSVFAGSPADQAGLKRGDVIVGYHDQAVDNAGRFSVLVSTTRGGDPVPIEIMRDGEELTLHTVIADRDQFLASAPADGEDQDAVPTLDWMGMEIWNFTPQIDRAAGLHHSDGVYVNRVYPGTPADYAAITRGAIIVQIGDESVKSVEDVERIADKLGKKPGRVALIVREPDGTLARKVIRT